MTNPQASRLNRLLAENRQYLIAGGLKGIEKESLRISKDGFISQKPHPAKLGSALTHPQITTDYSEALIELITPPYPDIQDTLRHLDEVHRYVYQHLDNEILLCTSMPCGIDGDESIPIANYGTSNIGKMKHVYRHGLWHRYGRTMQAIAGVHFNFSAPEALWPALKAAEQSPLPLTDYIAGGYFGLIRNFQRIGWLILYLFGASSAICKRFFKSRPELMAQFEELDAATLYHPFATSLRMSDIGYKSKNQANLRINYNSLPEYVDSLAHAINTPYPDYEKIGVEVDGEWRQLNANILQIENEFYSVIRPKQVADSGEKPTLALKRRGVRYVEMRSLDLDVFQPLGISEQTARFVEALLLTCLLQDSPATSEEAFCVNNRNQLKVANYGRKPGLELEYEGGMITLADWAHAIMESMMPVCQALDEGEGGNAYIGALDAQRLLVDRPELTPSARMLQAITASHDHFDCFAATQSNIHAAYFTNNPPPESVGKAFDEMAQQSLDKQDMLETQLQPAFDDFLKHYFAQQQ
jgi:glutamate--cysteine ligase